MAKHREYLQQAIQMAAENASSGAGGPYGALIVCNDQIIATGVNRVTENFDATAHAEVMAIREACLILKSHQLKNCILYTSCEPCPMCLGAIYWARMQSVYYACDHNDAAEAGFDDRFIYSEIALAPSARNIPIQHVSMADALLPFSHWKNSKTKVEY